MPFPVLPALSPSILLSLGLSIPTIYLSATAIRLLVTYPVTDIDPSHPVHRLNVDTSRFKQTDTHWFTARVPASLLRAPPSSSSSSSTRSRRYVLTPIERFTTAFFTTPSLSLEARFIGLFTNHGFTTGDLGERGLKNGLGLAHGTFSVVSLGKEHNRVVVKWPISQGLVASWERLASWGMPWRHISGGRHCLEVIFDEPRPESKTKEYATIRFGCVLDLEKRNPITGEEDGKVMPGFYVWIHEMYARWLLDGAVRRLNKMGNNSDLIPRWN
ncbi:hypothetical protein ABW19_dt0206205 [Dactylella cylindrospora]|nr:hypothetical protein ABW19_dt0206205 [Dactylella cylindrospora]